MNQNKTILGLLILAFILMGAGCATTSVSIQPVTTTPAPVPVEEEKEPEIAERYAVLTCPESTILFEGEDVTFCYETYTAENDSIVVTETASGVEIATQTNPDFVHKVKRLDFDPELDPQIAIETLYMTDADTDICEVVTQKVEGVQEYVIAGGGLDAQLSCGTYRDGFFRAYAEFPGSLLYIEIGQDTFFQTQTWLETLRPSR